MRQVDRAVGVAPSPGATILARIPWARIINEAQSRGKCDEEQNTSLVSKGLPTDCLLAERGKTGTVVEKVDGIVCDQN